MARRGRCRCGFVLKFQKGPEGYKTRCPSCGSVVRLKPIATRSTAKKRKASKRIDSRPAPAAEPGLTADRTVTCEVCYALVPARASHCPDCGSELDVTVAAQALDVEPTSRSVDHETPSVWRSILKSFSNRLILGWLTAGAVLLIAALVLILSLRH